MLKRKAKEEALSPRVLRSPRRPVDNESRFLRTTYDDAGERVTLIRRQKEFQEFIRRASSVCLELGKSEKVVERTFADITLIEEYLAGVRLGDIKKPLTVALLGPMGAGKSALVNSLVSVRNLMKESRGVSAGTKVIHELRYKEEGQISRFRRRVEYLSKDRIKGMVQKHADTLLLFVQSKALEGSNESEGFGQDQDPDFETTVKTAVDFFAAASESLDDELIVDRQSACEYFLELENEEGHPSLEHLIRYVQIAVKSLPVLERDSDSVESLEQEFNSLSPAWNFVEKVVTFYEHEILKVTTIADTAGNDDDDQDRVERSKEYVRHADIVLLVHRTERLLSSLRTQLSFCRKNNLLERTIIVCTRTDEGLDWESREQTASERNSLQGAEKDREDAKAAGESREARKYYERCVEDIKAQVGKRCLADEVCAMIKQLYNKTLPVHCVSNKEYALHLGPNDEKDGDKDGDSRPLPSININTTGIPNVRLHLFALAEDKILEPIEENVIEPLKLYNCKQILYRTREPAVNKIDLFQLIDQMEVEHKQAITAFARSFLKVIDAQVIVKMKNPDFPRKAPQVFHSERTSASNYVISKCRRNGIPARGNRDDKDWNEAIIEIYRDGDDDLFPSLLKSNQTHRINLRGKLRSLSENGRLVLHKQLESTSISCERFFEALKEHHDSLDRRVKQIIMGDFKSQMTRIQQQLMNPNPTAGTYIGRAMLRSYQNAVLLRPKKDKSLARLNVLCLTVSRRDDNVFFLLGEYARSDFKSGMDRTEDDLFDAVKTTFKRIRRDIDIKFSDDLGSARLRNFNKEEESFMYFDGKISACVERLRKCRSMIKETQELYTGGV